MDASNWINLGMLVVTTGGVAVSIVAALKARGSAKEASSHEAAAAVAARDAADASTRSATALEEANELARASARQPRWTIAQVAATAPPRSAGQNPMDRWLLRNTGEGAVSNVRISVRDVIPDGWRSTAFPAAELLEGLGGEISVMRYWGRPAALALEVKWTDAAGAEEEAVLQML